jgi:hypothetical protein
MKPHWDINEIKNLNYITPDNPTRGFNYVDSKDSKRYNHIIAHLHTGLSASFDENLLDKEFDWLKHKSYSINKMQPGEILPFHYDKYGYYTKTYRVEIEDVHRIIVFLDDWKAGHFLQFLDKAVVNWQAGDWETWQGSTIHSAGNFGHEDRYVLQITGIRNDI